MRQRSNVNGMKPDMDVRDNFISKMASEYSAMELCDMFHEIALCKDTAILQGDKLKAFEQKIRKITKTPGGTMFREAEYAIVYEMARRFFNSQRVLDNYGLLKDGDTVWYGDPDGVEMGKVKNIVRKDGKIDSFGVDFGYDFDEFCADAIGSSIFLTEEEALSKMKNGGSK